VFKQQVYAPGRYTGYAAQFLPAIEDALKANDLATARRYTGLFTGSLNAAAADAARACDCGP
jgi:N-acetylated-alpha-linked acidic dipeptidase